MLNTKTDKLRNICTVSNAAMVTRPEGGVNVRLDDARLNKLLKKLPSTNQWHKAGQRSLTQSTLTSANPYLEDGLTTLEDDTRLEVTNTNLRGINSVSDL